MTGVSSQTTPLHHEKSSCALFKVPSTQLQERKSKPTNASSNPKTSAVLGRFRLLPDLRRYTVARFHNITDAQDHLRVLNCFIPVAEFEVIFESEAGCDRELVPTDLEGEEC